jgi:hypothetical protein
MNKLQTVEKKCKKTAEAYFSTMKKTIHSDYRSFDTTKKDINDAIAGLIKNKDIEGLEHFMHALENLKSEIEDPGSVVA